MTRFLNPRRAMLSVAYNAPQTAAFLARTSGLDRAHITAYRGLINGGVVDGWFQKMDILLVFATQDSVTALLNLPSATYTQTNTGCTFTADRGFGLSGGAGQVSSTYNPATATSPNFVQNSAHVSYWDTVNSPEGVNLSFNGAPGTNIFAKFAGDSNTYMRVNDSPESGGLGVLSAPHGQLLGNRDGSTTRQAYQNGLSAFTYGSQASTGVNNAPLTMIGDGVSGYTAGCAAASVGGSLSATDVLNFYTRLRTFLTTVGAP